MQNKGEKFQKRQKRGGKCKRMQKTERGTDHGLTPVSSIDPDDRLKYIDDLSILQLICLAGLLTDYDFKQHVA